jgi:hypothetical protein
MTDLVPNSVYISYRKPLGDNIYKQWELRLMVVWLEIETWVMVKVALKGVVEKEGG